MNKFENSDKLRVLNVNINNISFCDALKIKDGIIFTPNMDHLLLLQKNMQFFQAYMKSDFCLCDSQVLINILKILGLKVKERISGSDYFKAFCKLYSQDDTVRVFVLGGLNNSADYAKININKQYNSNIIVGSFSPPVKFHETKEGLNIILNKIKSSNANVLAVCFGSPKQEIFIAENINKFYDINVRLIMAVGATVDFESGLIKRAPKLISNIGMEWCYRLFQDPKRLIKRYLNDCYVIFLLFLFRIKLYKSPFIFFNKNKA